jgi:hypothetical protein
MVIAIAFAGVVVLLAGIVLSIRSYNEIHSNGYSSSCRSHLLSLCRDFSGFSQGLSDRSRAALGIFPAFPHLVACRTGMGRRRLGDHVGLRCVPDIVAQMSLCHSQSSRPINRPIHTPR